MSRRPFCPKSMESDRHLGRTFLFLEPIRQKCGIPIALSAIGWRGGRQEIQQGVGTSFSAAIRFGGSCATSIP